jgi:hypothetical protein
VEATRATLPELELVRHETPAAPVRRARDRFDPVEGSLLRLDETVEFGAISDDRRLR